jgi:hypothetical protein
MTEALPVHTQSAKNAALVQFTSDGGLIVTTDPHVCAWRVPSLERAYRVRPLLGQLGRVTVQSTGPRIVCAGWRGEFAVLDSATGETLATCVDEHYPPERPAALSACGNFLIYGSRRGARVCEISSNQVQWEHEFERAIVSSISPIEAGRRWAFLIYQLPGANENWSTPRVEIWSWPFGSAPERVIRPAFLTVGDVAVHRSGMVAMVGVAEPGRTTVRVYGTDQEEPLGEDEVDVMDRPIAWLNDLQFACAADGRISIRSAATTKVVSEIEIPSHSRYACCFGPGGTDLAIGYFPHGFAYSRGVFDEQRRVRIENPWPHRRVAPKTAIHRPVADVWHSNRAATPKRSITADTMAELKSKLREFQRPAWTPVLGATEGPVTASKIGGTPNIVSSSDWPHCGACGDFLQLLIQLHPTDLPDELRGLFVGTLQVFFCTSEGCAPWQPFSRVALARFAPPAATAVFASPPFPETFIGRQIVAWERHVDYPTEQELEQLGVTLENGPDFGGEFLSPLECDKLMGWPGWPQDPAYAKCPKCENGMRTILQIASEQCVPYMFGDGGSAWVSQCEKHKDVLAFHCRG